MFTEERGPFGAEWTSTAPLSISHGQVIDRDRFISPPNYRLFGQNVSASFFDGHAESIPEELTDDPSSYLPLY